MKYLVVKVPFADQYATAGEQRVERLKELLRPGDRIVSVYPVGYQQPPNMSHPFVVPVVLEALLELRHPSWQNEDVGWDADEGEKDDPLAVG